MDGLLAEHVHTGFGRHRRVEQGLADTGIDDETRRPRAMGGLDQGLDHRDPCLADPGQDDAARGDVQPIPARAGSGIQLGGQCDATKLAVQRRSLLEPIGAPIRVGQYRLQARGVRFLGKGRRQQLRGLRGAVLP